MGTGVSAYALMPAELVRAHRGRALSPERPFIRGTAQNPDVYFQARESVNPFYAAVPGAVQDAMDGLAALEGLHRIEAPGRVTSTRELPAVVPAHAPEFVRTITAMMMAGHGDDLAGQRAAGGRHLPERYRGLFIEALAGGVLAHRGSQAA